MSLLADTLEVHRTTDTSKVRGPHAAMADSVMENIRGSEAAKAVVSLIARDVSDPDSLLDALQAVLVTLHRDRLRGFLRQIQKALEAGR